MMSVQRVLLLLLLQKQFWHYNPLHCIKRQTISLLIPAIIWSPDSVYEIMETVGLVGLYHRPFTYCHAPLQPLWPVLTRPQH